MDDTKRLGWSTPYLGGAGIEHLADNGSSTTRCGLPISWMPRAPIASRSRRCDVCEPTNRP